MALVLVTGAAGFIGSNVARALSGLGHQVVGSDRLGRDGKWRNLLGTQLHDLITPGALPVWLAAHKEKVEMIIHLGASSDTTETNADKIVVNNIRLSIDLWNWCALHGVRFVYASSAATYGDGSQGFQDNEQGTFLAYLRPLNAYGWSKHFVDMRVMSDVEAGRPLPRQWAGVKLFNVYGPGENAKGEMRSLITKIIPIIKSGGSISLFKSYRLNYDDGEQMRDFVFVDDVVSVILWLFSTPSISGLFNVGSGIARTWNDVVRIASAYLGRSPRIEYVEMPDYIRAQYQYYTQAPIEKLRLAGWSADTTSLETGISSYIERQANERYL